MGMLHSFAAKLLPAALLCCGFAEAKPAKVFIKVGERASGFSGLTLGENGRLYICNGLYKNIKEFNPNNKQFTGTLFDSPEYSFLDDITTIPADPSRSIIGGYSFTGFLDGRVTTVLNDGTVIHSNPGPFIPCFSCGSNNITFDPNLIGVNPIAYRSSNDRLYLASIFNPTQIVKLDWRGISAPEAIPLIPPTPLNAFSFGPDGFLYAPATPFGKVVKIDVDTGLVTDVVTGIISPIAVEADANGKLYILSRTTGELLQYDPNTQNLTLFAALEPALDNLVIDNEKGKIYVTNDQNKIFRVDIGNGIVKEIFDPPIRGPGELAIDCDSLYFADTSSVKEVDAKSAQVIRNLITDSVGSALIGYGVLSGITVEAGTNGKIIAIDVTSSDIRVLNKTDFSLYESFSGSETGLGGKQPYSAVRVVSGETEFYLATNTVDGKIIKIYRDNGTVVAEDFLTGLLAPVKLKIKEGDLYIVEAGNVLFDVPNTGKVRKIEISNPSNQVILLSNLNNPQGLDLYCEKMVIAEVGNRRVIEASAIAPSVPLTLYSNLKTGLSPLQSPLNPVPIGTFTGVAVNSDGSRIYVTQNKPNNVLLIKQ